MVPSGLGRSVNFISTYEVSFNRNFSVLLNMLLCGKKLKFITVGYDSLVGMAGSLNIQVNVNVGESPESPPPWSPSPVLPQPIPLGELSRVWELPDDGTNFLNYYTPADIIELKTSAQVTRDRINEEVYFVKEPTALQRMAAFLRQNYGPQWEWEFLRPSTEVIFEKLLGYIAGYSRLTSLNRRLPRQQFESWTVEEKAKQLRVLAESGGFLEIE